MYYESIVLLSEPTDDEIVFDEVEVNQESNMDPQSEMPTEALPPCGLYEFNGIVHKKNVVLSWKTKSELYKPHFVIERSVDGVNFRKVGFINAYVESVIYTFEFVDENIMKLGAPVLYYRLKQSRCFSGYTVLGCLTLGININLSPALFTLNNKANEILLNLYLARSAVVMVDILNDEGCLVKSNIWNLRKGFTSFPICINGLLPGKYRMKIKGGHMDELKVFEIE